MTKKISQTEDMYNMHYNTWYRIDVDTFVMRVPGGWVYKMGNYPADIVSTTFVPFNSEGMK